MDMKMNFSMDEIRLKVEEYMGHRTKRISLDGHQLG